MRTPAYAALDNRQYRRAEVQIDEQGHGRATVRTTSTGEQQDELARCTSCRPTSSASRPASAWPCRPSPSSRAAGSRTTAAPSPP
ncbi:hypothetical protein [Hymenobacter jeollabukensis]|uniref:Uncharacterized protein n=1 Tax=Hymenobacter jeollabukensis TaxID=2025313 RepID=A0A5R8WRZ8_9BACT|nr:hypothetical protein [Hymenobacter jeollabukensis]TLM93223.1 hypothetical protein FDY95_11410 [Hymenobacter jeollabukensis]